MVINIFLFGSYGEPLRDSEVIRDRIISTPFDYKVVPEKMIGSPAQYHSSHELGEIGEGLGRKKIAIVKGLVLVADTVPDRFKPIMAIHERGHHYGLSHQEMFTLELGMADKLAEITGDKSLKEDYLRWSKNKCSDKKFFDGMVKRNLGQEKQMNIDMMINYMELKKEAGVDGIYTMENDNLVELF